MERIDYSHVRLAVKDNVFDANLKEILKIKLENYDPDKRYEPLESIMGWIIPPPFMENIDINTEKALHFILYHSMQKYGELQRKMGGYYQNHPLCVSMLYGLNEVSHEGKNDPPGIIACWDHDLTEEYISSEIQKEIDFKLEKYPDQEKKKLRNDLIEEFYPYEKEMINDYLNHLYLRRKNIMTHRLNLNEENITNLLIPALNVTKSLTRLGAQTYYHSVYNLYHHGIFGFREKYARNMKEMLKSAFLDNLFPQGIEVRRTVKIKLCDAICNTINLRERDKPGWNSRDELKVNRIMQVYEKNTSLIDKLDQYYLASSKKHPDKKRHKRLRGVDRLNRIFKNIILINMIRMEKSVFHLENPTKPLENILIKESLEETINIMDHLAAYHIKPINVVRIVNEGREYDMKGGFSMVTQKKSGSSYDGILESFFDKRIRGIDDPLDELDKEENKPTLLRSAIGFKYILEDFKEKENYIFKGITKKGIVAR